MADQEFLPAAGSALPHVGTYRRSLPVSLERLYENALDWEHLPHLHAARFAAVRCEAAGAWGWRVVATLADGTTSTLELTLDRICRRWIARTVAGSGAGAEIWTHAAPDGPGRVDVVVDFFVPDVTPDTRERVGRAYACLYTELYDEDEAMMVERQRQLDRRLERAGAADRSCELGPREGLALPQQLVLGGREYLLVEVAGTLAVFPRQCPHQLGPLSVDALDGAVVTCPWHGYRFDVLSGANVDGGPCRLSQLPLVEVDGAGIVRVSARH